MSGIARHASIVIACLAAASSAQSSSAPTTFPTTAPATRPTANVSVDAAPLLDALAKTYSRVEPLRVTGVIVGDFDVAGRKKVFTLRVSGITDGAGRFIHKADGSGLLVNNGKQAYLFDSKRDTFAELPAMAARVSPAELDESVVNVLLDENPALLLTLTSDPAGLLKQVATKIHLSQTPPGGANKQLVLELPQKRITLSVDPTRDTITSSTIDYASVFKARGATDVKSVKAVLTYEPAKSHFTADDFAWSPPADATEISLGGELLRPG